MLTNEQMINDLAGVCRFASVAKADPANETAPYGEEVHKALLYMLDLCKKFGFRTKNCDNKIGYAEIGEGEEMIGILAHLDVVPAGDGWMYPAYDATDTGERIYGRGVCDDKGPAIASVYAMKDLLDSGVELKRRIRIIFGQTEENGDWTDMEYYKETEELPTFGFTPDGNFPAIYGEKGIFHAVVSMNKNESGLVCAEGGAAVNVVPDYAKAVVVKDGQEVTYEATGKSAHGSTPEEGVNAIANLMKKMADDGVKSKFVDFFNTCIGFDVNGGKAGVGFSDEQSGLLTLNAGVITTTEDAITQTLDIRHPVTISSDQVYEGLMKAMGSFGIAISDIATQKAVYMDKNGELITTLVNVYREETGDMTEPMVIGGGTYAKAMDHIVVFGPMISGREATEHQRNEYLLKEDFLLLRKIYGKALYKLAAED
ncbi:MAG: Sapep family Mn(2+)-dependent dipeptidase [Lachnospiraceae bacterium]|nr:Sapep family Mn(2+)-dependent dipeptidase [Lachnospiraceae bacterium]